MMEVVLYPNRVESLLILDEMVSGSNDIKGVGAYRTPGSPGRPTGGVY